MVMTVFSRGNQILHGDIVLIKADGSSSVIAVFLCDFEISLRITPSNILRSARMAFNSLDVRHQLFVLVLDLLPFQTGQSAQTHVYDCLGLGIGQDQSVPSGSSLQLCRIRGCTDDAGSLRQYGQALLTVLPGYVRSLLRFVQVVFRTSCHNLFLMCSDNAVSISRRFMTFG